MIIQVKKNYLGSPWSLALILIFYSQMCASYFRDKKLRSTKNDPVYLLFYYFIYFHINKQLMMFTFSVSGIPIFFLLHCLQLLAFTSQKKMPEYATDLRLVHRVHQFDYLKEQEELVEVLIPKRVRNNGSLYLHIFLTSPSVDPEVRKFLWEPYFVYSLCTIR